MIDSTSPHCSPHGTACTALSDATHTQISFDEEFLNLEEDLDVFVDAMRLQDDVHDDNDDVGGELYTWGSNANFNLGHQAEASKALPERVVRKHVISRFSLSWLGEGCLACASDIRGIFLATVSQLVLVMRCWLPSLVALCLT